jgi:MFS family permease
VGFGSILVFTFGIFLKPLSAEFGWTRSQVSLAFTVTALTVAVCSPFIGKLLDRYPARRIILPCVAIYGAGFCSLSLLTPHLWHLLGVFVLLGVVGNGTTQLGYARVVSAWFDRSRGRALAAVMAGSGAGSMVFPPVAQAIITAYGWRTAYVVLGVIILLLGIPLAAVFLREPAHDVKRGKADRVETDRRLRKDLLSFAFLCMVAGLVLFSMATNGLNEHLSPLLTDRGFGAQQAAGVLSLLGLSSLLSRLATGYLLDRFFAPRIAFVLFCLCALGMLVTIFANSLWLAYLGAVLVGVGMGAESDTVPFLLSRYFSLQRLSELYAYTWSAYAVAGALGPLAMGKAFDRTHSYDAVVLVFCGMVIVSAILFGILPRYTVAKRRTTAQTAESRVV